VLVHPRIVIGVPSEITPVEKRAVQDSAYRARASEVFLVEQAMAAAIGAGLPIEEPSGNMVVDIGGGTTDIAVISMSGIVYSRSVRVAGNEMDEAVMQYLKRKYNLLVGERTAEQIKMEIGSAYPLEKPLTMEVKGRNLIEGVPRTVTIDDSEIRESLSECVATIVNAVRVALERTPPELSADISDRGIVLTGGGALLKNLDKRIREETATAYGAWIRQVKAGIGGRPATVIVEPDALPAADCTGPGGRTARFAALADAVSQLSSTRRRWCTSTPATRAGAARPTSPTGSARWALRRLEGSASTSPTSTAHRRRSPTVKACRRCSAARTTSWTPRATAPGHPPMGR